MNQHRLRVRHSGAIAIIDLEGDLSHDSEGPLLGALRDPHVLPSSVVVLNFAGVGYINSAGISLLVSLVAEVIHTERTLLACCLSPHYRKIFRMVGLTEYIQVFETELDALRGTEPGKAR